MSERKPRAPAGLSAPGKRLWRRVTGELELRPDELSILEHAARTADELARLQAALSEAKVTVAGSTGQVRAHPLYAEVRQHRDLLRRLLAALEVQDAGKVEDAVFPAAMSNSERSARMRWRSHRIEQAARKEQERGA